MDQYKKFTRSFVSLVSVPLALSALTVYSTTAVAQEDESAALDEIVVTSRYRAERLQQTPIAITALTGEELEIRAFQSAYEVGYTVPNASLRPAQAAYGNTMTAFIRGIGQYDFNFAFEPGVGIYIDDVYHPFTMGSQIDLLDLERVEVLRGPQGTLFGRGAIGGAIRYVSKRPEGDGSGNVAVTMGDFDRMDVRASYDFALTENVFARVAGVSKSRDGYQDRIDFACKFPEQAGNLNPMTPNRGNGCKIGTAGGEDVTGGRVALRMVPSEDFEITLTAEFLDDDSETRADTITEIVQVGGDDLWDAFYNQPRTGVSYDERFLPPNIYTSYATFADPTTGQQLDPKTAFEKTSVSAALDWSITDDINAKLVVARADISSSFAVDQDGSPIVLQNVDGTQDISSTTVELRLSGRAADKLDWTVGGFFYDGTADSWQSVDLPWLTYLLDVFLPNSFGPSVLLGDITFEEGAQLMQDDPNHYTFVKSQNLHDADHQSVFAHVVFDINDSWSVNAGGRYSEDEKRVEFDNSRVVNPLVQVKDDHFDWRVGADWRITDDAMLYASASTGYRPGSYNPRPFQATQVVPVNAEEALSYDLGIKMDLLDNTLRLNLAAFMFDYETRILPVGGTECPLLDLGPPPVYATVDPSDPGAVQDSLGNWCTSTVSRTFYENGPADITGIEAEILWQPTDALTISGQLGMLNWDSPDVNDNPASISDQPVFVPDQNWSLGVNYRINLDNGGSLSPRIDAYGQSEICTAQVNENGCSDGYSLVNVSVNWASADDDWMVAFGVTNLTDEEYFLNKFDLTGFGQQMTEGQPGRPQEWYVRLTRNF